MLNHLAFSCLFISLSFCFPLIAFEDVSKEMKEASEAACGCTESISPRCEDSFFTLGGNYSRVYIKPDTLSSLDGNLGGAHAMYEYRPMDFFYGALGFAWRQGSVSGSDGRRSIVDLDAAERVGYTFSFRDQASFFTLFSGFGFRFLRHHIKPASSLTTPFIGSFFPPFISGSTSLKVDYHEFYIPLGFLLEGSLNSWFTLGLYGTWMPQVFSTAYIRPLGGAYWKLKKTYGNVLAEIPFIFGLSKRSSLVLKPFFSFWQDGRSKAKTSSGVPLGLPENTYYFWGIDVNFTFSF